MVTEYIPRYVKIGSKDKYWYEKQTEFFISIFGAERLPLVTKLFAATSINSSLASNVRLFRKALHEIENDLPFSNYLPVMLKQLELIRSGNPFNGRKINSFANAMSGDHNAVVVDIWLLRAFEMNKQYPRQGRMRESGASDKDYTLIETWVREHAKEYEATPRQLSAMIWSGKRIAATGNHNTNYIQTLQHQLYSMYEDI